MSEKIYKYVCECGHFFFSEADDEFDCEVYMEEDDDDDDACHTLTRIDERYFTAKDYVRLWEMDLENANHHSQEDMPHQIFEIISKYVKNKTILRKIFKMIYEQSVGV